MFVMEVFLSQFDLATTHREYNPLWGDNTTSYEGAVNPNSQYRVIVPVGDIATSVDPDGNRMLFIGAKKGTVLVFERKKPGQKRSMFLLNEPSDEFCKRGIKPNLTDESLLLILGLDDTVIN